MLKVSLEQWRMFRAVVDHGRFNQASQAIHKSQSSIHHAVHKIEDALGVKLLTVEGRKTRLTASGELMLRRANYLLDEAAKLEAVGITLAEGIETRLSLAVDEVFPRAILYRALEATSAQFPLLRIELRESVLTGANELLDASDVDLAVSPFPGKEGFSEELCNLEFIAVAHPAHPLHALGRDITLEDLKSYRQIVVRDSAIGARQDNGWLGAEQRWTVGHVSTSVEMISEGLGFAWLPRSTIRRALDEGSLKPLRLANGATRSTALYLLFNDADRLGPAARAFIGELRFATMQMTEAAP